MNNYAACVCMFFGVVVEGWHPSRDANGTLVPYAEFFPHGMVPVIDFVHSLGLKFGLYVNVQPVQSFFICNIVED